MARLPDEILLDDIALRRWREEHLDLAFDALQRSFDELRLWLSWSQTVPTRDELLWWLQDGEAGFEKDQAWEYFIFEIESNELVGMAGLNNSRVAAGAIEISYWIRSDRTGRGYATEATRALVDNVLANVEEITSIEIHMDAANHASASIPQKLGFSLLREEYSERRAIAHTGRDQVWRLRRSR